MPVSREERLAQKKRWRLANLEDQKAKNRACHSKRRARLRSLLKEFSCFCCGDPDDTVIQWHHVDETLKDFEIFGSGNGTAEDTWWNEVLKCIPLCANCHVKIHKNKLCLIPPKLR